MYKYVCDRCGSEIKVIPNAIRITLDDDDWSNTFDLCESCQIHFKELVKEYIIADWEWKKLCI